jgi:hypothetical protein
MQKAQTVNAGSRTLAFIVVAALALGAVVGALGWLARSPGDGARGPVWTEVPWPFPTDQWGRGKAFQCKPADCGTEVRLYLRAKLGFCDCTTGVADDDDLDRMSDFDLIGSDVAPLGAGRPIAVGAMQGRSRAYALIPRNSTDRTAISVVFNDRCDMVSAIAVLPHDPSVTIEPRILGFLNSPMVLRWVEATLGL